ncbi:MAG: hypothetical protein AAGA11_11365 [Pseudomonadota bacterium]
MLLGTGVLGVAPLAATGSEGPDLSLPTHAHAPVRLSLPTGSAENARAALQVFVGDASACCTHRTPIAGQHQVSPDDIAFHPAFPFEPEQPYTVRVGDALVVFVVPRKTALTAPAVTAAYPSGAQLPANTLRFYLHFSTPMQPHRAHDFIRLVDANGKADPAAFMAFKQELWNRERTRLTVLLDPGRIKRGVAQNRTLGPALVDGQQYALVVEAGWPSADGRGTAPRFEHRFTVTGALRSRPRVDHWTITPPRRGGHDALLIGFDRAFDAAQARDAITVWDNPATPVPGEVQLDAGERGWRFVPHRPWASHQVEVRVDPRLEDVAGNNFRERLDHPNGEAAATPNTTRTLALPPA